MNVLRNQWSVSGQTVAVMQLSGSDEMRRVERGVPSSSPGHQSCRPIRANTAVLVCLFLIAALRKMLHFQNRHEWL